MAPGMMNGSCHLNDDEWVEYRERAQKLESMVGELHSNTKTLVAHTSHLSKLDNLTEIKDKLLDTATNKNQLDIGIAKMIFMILGGVILSLIFVIVFLLTGEKLGLLNLVQHASSSV